MKFLHLILLLTLSFGFHSQAHSETDLKVICTAALIPQQYEMRKQEYLHTLENLKNLGVVPYIVEACTKASFFDDSGCPVFYPGVNDPNLKNKGVNEARLLQEGLKHFQFNDNDMILKITGRYYFDDGYFINTVRENPQYDAFVRRPESDPAYTFAGCYAFRCRIFKQFLSELNLNKMETDMIDMELELGRFLDRHPEIKVLNTKLNITANIFGCGECRIYRW